MKTLMIIMLVLALLCFLIFLSCVVWALIDDIKKVRKTINGIPLSKEEWREYK